MEGAGSGHQGIFSKNQVIQNQQQNLRDIPRNGFLQSITRQRSNFLITAGLSTFNQAGKKAFQRGGKKKK